MWDTLPPITVQNAGQMQQKARIEHAGISSLAWAPDSCLLAAGDWIPPDAAPGPHGAAPSAPCAIMLHALDDLDGPPRRLDGHRHTVTALAFSPDGRRLASASADRKLRIWDVAGGTVHNELELPGYYLRSLAFSPDGRWLVAGGAAVAGDSWSGRGLLFIWDVATRLAQVDRPYEHWVDGIVFHPQGDLFAFYTLDGTARLWDVAAQAERATFAGPRNLETMGLHFTPDGLLLVPSDDYQTTLERWDWTHDRRTTLARLPYNTRRPAFHPTAPIMAQSSSPPHDGKKRGQDGIELWDWTRAPATTRPLTVLEPRGNAIFHLAFSPDGRLLASADVHTIRIWGAKG